MPVKWLLIALDQAVEVLALIGVIPRILLRRSSGFRGRLVDSLQHGDEPLYDPLLDRFPVAFHEPYYADYVGQDLTALLADAGLRVDAVELAFLSKVVVATRV